MRRQPSCSSERSVSLTKGKSTPPGLASPPAMTRSTWLRVRTMLQTCSTASAPSNCTRQARATECTVSPGEYDTRWRGNRLNAANPATVGLSRRLCALFDDLAENEPISFRDRQTVPALPDQFQSGTAFDRVLSASIRTWDNPDRRARHPQFSFRPQPIGP